MDLKYRPEIDGLRTIAVLAVIIYHAEIYSGGTQLLKGGFFGVDVFFVISGFLITSILIKEYQKNSTFSISNFYERRARRILPVLLFVILISLPAAYILLLPTQLDDYTKSIFSTLAFGSNFYWDATLQEYGAESALIKPFLHTWTLAIEEQYYIIFPLILLVIYKWVNNHITSALITILLFSLIFSHMYTTIDASSSFYMLPSRFWELLAGSLLAHSVYFYCKRNSNTLLNRAMPTLGLYLIIHSMMFIDFEAHHPGIITLLPIIGTILIIFFANKNEPVTQLLSSKLFVSIGLISYSLYLWHYPIFAFGRIIDSEPTWQTKSLWVGITFALSLISYFIIEKPARNRSAITRKLFLTLIAALSIVIFFVLSLFLQKSKNNESHTDILPERHSQFNWAEHGYSVCHRKSKINNCNPADNQKNNILIVGDSMTPDATKILTALYPENNYIMSWEGGCPPVKEIEKKFKSTDRKESCKRLNQQRFTSRYTNNIDGVVIITLSAMPEIEEYIIHLKEHSKNNIIIFGNYLNNTKNMSDLLKKHKTPNRVEEIINSKKLIKNKKQTEPMFESLSQKHKIEYISIRDYACDTQDKCLIFIGNTPYSWDKHHFSSQFTDFLTKEMRNDIEKTWLGKKNFNH